MIENPIIARHGAPLWKFWKVLEILVSSFNSLYNLTQFYGVYYLFMELYMELYTDLYTEVFYIIHFIY